MLKQIRGFFLGLAIITVGSSCAFMNETILDELLFAELDRSTSKNELEEWSQAWVNGDINRLITARGIPSNEYTMPNGSTLYSWLWVGGTHITAGYNDFLNRAYANRITNWCRHEFTASESGVIQSWRYEGNACY